jgi:hypothetical protein
MIVDMSHGRPMLTELERANEMARTTPVVPSVPGQGGRVKLWDEVHHESLNGLPVQPTTRLTSP